MQRVFVLLFLCIGVYNHSFAQENQYILWDIAWSKDGNHIVSGGSNQMMYWINPKTFALERKDTVDFWIERLRWNPVNQNLLAIAGSKGPILWDQDTKLFSYLDTTLFARAISWNSDGTLLAFADYECALYIYDLKGQVKHEYEQLCNKGFTGVDWHPEKDELILIGDSIIHIDIDGKKLDVWANREIPILDLSVEWHPSGNFFAHGDYGDDSHTPMLHFWSDEGELVMKSAASEKEFRNLKWSPDGTRLATASDQLRIWNVKGTILCEGPSTANLWGVDWSPNGSTIATSSEKGEIVFWDTSAKRLSSINVMK